MVFERLLFLAMILNFYSFSKCDSSKFPSGHGQVLGAHLKPQGITWSGSFTSPFTFHGNFVLAGKPILMKEVLQQADHPGLTKWTNDFLRNRFGSELVKVEKNKIEDRNSSPSWMSFREFLKIYETDDVYMVHSLRSNMKDLVLIPTTLQCGGFQHLIQDAVFWMGSRHTSSVLHRDPLDNLLCVVHGEKYVKLIDKTFKSDVEQDGFDEQGGYSKVDPQRVNFEQFSRLAHVPWHEADLKKGDCLFIPQGWYHQVTSSAFRHIGINIWFSHLWWYNSTDCTRDMSVRKPLEHISTFGFASPNEAYRSNLLSRFYGEGIIGRDKLHELLPNNPTKGRANELFNAINKFPDGALSWSELYTFDIDKILMEYWDLFDLPGAPNIPQGKVEDTRVNDDFTDIDDSVSDPSVYENIQTADVSEESNIPLPDAMSTNTPSLPDDSVDANGMDFVIEYENSKENVHEDDYSEFDSFHYFIESSNDIPSNVYPGILNNGSAEDGTDTVRMPKNQKDEL